MTDQADKTLYGGIMTDQADKTLDLLTRPLVAINLGLDNFAQSLEGQGVEVVRVDWKPPAGGDQEMIALLDQLL